MEMGSRAGGAAVDNANGRLLNRVDGSGGGGGRFGGGEPPEMGKKVGEMCRASSEGSANSHGGRRQRRLEVMDNGLDGGRRHAGRELGRRRLLVGVGGVR